MKKYFISMGKALHLPYQAAGRMMIALVAIIAFGYSAQAQTTQSESSKNDLLAQRQQLVSSGISTRSVDAQLLAYNVKFPAEVTVEETATSRIFTFTAVRNYTEENAVAYANRMAREFASVQSVSIDYRTGICMVVFSKLATETEVNNLFGRLQFNGYTIK